MTDELRKATLTTDRSALEGPLDRAGRSKRAQVRNAELLAAALAMIAGFVDAYGMITYGVYVSFMSGNTTQTGYQTAEGAFGPASLSALAILFFVVGSFAGTLLVRVRGTLCAAGLVLRGRSRAGGDRRPDAVRHAIRRASRSRSISVAMGVMNNALSRVGAQAVSLTFVTGSLSRVGSSLALAAEARAASDAQGPWDTHLRRALLLARLWLGFLVGALLSGAATPRYGALVLRRRP